MINGAFSFQWYLWQNKAVSGLSSRIWVEWVFMWSDLKGCLLTEQRFINQLHRLAVVGNWSISIAMLPSPIFSFYHPSGYYASLACTSDHLKSYPREVKARAKTSIMGVISQLYSSNWFLWSHGLAAVKWYPSIQWINFVLIKCSAF